MIFIQGFIFHHALVQVVTVITNKPHQLPVIKFSYPSKLIETINEACPLGSKRSFPKEIHLRMTYRKPFLCSRFFTLDLEHQVNLRFVHQYTSKILTQLSNTRIPNYRYHTNTPIQYSIPHQKGELSPESKKYISVSTKYTHLNNCSILTQLPLWLPIPLENLFVLAIYLLFSQSNTSQCIVDVLKKLGMVVTPKTKIPIFSS